MDAHNAVQRIVAILVIMVGLCFPVFAGPVHIYRGTLDLRIPADPDSSKGWMNDAIIDVPDHLTICDLDVGISLTHTSVFDLQIFLQSPAGTRICLNMYNPFDGYFKGQDYAQTIFDDQAQTPIEQAQPPFTGRFRPLEPYKLSEFDDEDAYGPWRLQIYDAFYADTGSLDSFELMITTPEPTTAILLVLGAGLAMRLGRRRGR